MLLNVYDIGPVPDCCWTTLNKACAPCAGAFHAGIEVNGLEWSFAGEDSATPGVGCTEPRCHPLHRYRQTVHLGFTQCSPEDIAKIIGDLVEEYDEYCILTCNCCHFADDFSRRLGLNGIPRWVSLCLARSCSSVVEFLGEMVAAGESFMGCLANVATRLGIRVCEKEVEVDLEASEACLGAGSRGSRQKPSLPELPPGRPTAGSRLSGEWEPDEAPRHVTRDGVRPARALTFKRHSYVSLRPGRDQL